MTTLTVPSVKLTLPLPPDRLPRVPLDGPIQPVDWVIEVASTLGAPPLRIPVSLNGQSYRQVLRQADELGQQAVVVLHGKLTGDGRLEEARISVQVRPPKPSAPANRG
jgi:hypothetical protein